jgi:hypothetical protein
MIHTADCSNVFSHSTFDVGRSMLDVHSFFSFLFDQTGRFAGQRPG